MNGFPPDKPEHETMNVASTGANEEANRQQVSFDEHGSTFDSIRRMTMTEPKNSGINPAILKEMAALGNQMISHGTKGNTRVVSLNPDISSGTVHANPLP